MEAIKKVWFDSNRMYVQLADGMVLNRPLEAFPTLKDASDAQREKYEINRFGDALRWSELDEDIHVDSFLETTEPQFDNEVARLLNKFSWIDVAEVARLMNIHKSVLDSYRYGMVQPTPLRLSLLRDALHIMGTKLLSA